MFLKKKPYPLMNQVRGRNDLQLNILKVNTVSYTTRVKTYFCLLNLNMSFYANFKTYGTTSVLGPTFI